jgi:hypothetical protein
MIEEKMGFERFTELAQKIERADHAEAARNKRIEIERHDSDVKSKIGRLYGDDLWEECARRYLLLSPAEMSLRQCLLEEVQIDVDQFRFDEAILKTALWEQLQRLKVRLCDDHGKVVEVDLTDTQYRRQNWGGIRLGLCDNLRIWIGESEQTKQNDAVGSEAKSLRAKSMGKPGRTYEHQRAYDFLEDKISSGFWSVVEGRIHDENGNHMGRHKLYDRLYKELSKKFGKEGFSMPADKKPPTNWVKKITVLD